jgi:RNA polymerase sigma-70 factor (ECF subfamily)
MGGGSSEVLVSGRKPTGHDAAYLDLVDRYEAAILNYIYRLVDDAEVAEDLTQDTFVKAYQARDRLDLDEQSEGRRRAWLYRIAHNTAADHLRRKARLRWLPLHRSLADPADDPEATAVTAATVQRALSRLAEPHREVLHLFFEAGLTAQEASEVLGVAPDAARKRLQRARAALEAALAAGGMSPTEGGSAP